MVLVLLNAVILSGLSGVNIRDIDHLASNALILVFQTWDPRNVPLALSCAVRVFRLLSQVTLLRFVSD